MSNQTNIEWADSTFNPWMGCTKVSPACDHCYAERDTRRFGRVEWGAGKPRVRTSAVNWKLPERWNRAQFVECTDCGWRGEYKFHQCSGLARLKEARRRVFCASLADWLDNEVPINWLVDLLDLIRRTPNLDWLLLTKRIGNLMPRLRAAAEHARAVSIGLDDPLAAWINAWHNGNPPANVWIGATVINQAEANRDVPKLLTAPAVVRFLSIEPMLGPVILDGSDHHVEALAGWYAHVDWIIAGGESGPHARPMHPDWVRSLRDQCAAAGVPFLFKQWGEWAPGQCCDRAPIRTEQTASWSNGAWEFGEVTPRQSEEMHRDDEPELYRIGKKAAGRMLDGREHTAFPSPKP